MAHNARKYFKVDARTLLQLGRESIKDHITALVELVKNSYDADATVVEVEIRSEGATESDNYIRIADNGLGMSEKDLEEKWLRIGYSTKRRRVHTTRSRRATGEKGIGRLSADRLGANLDIVSKANGHALAGLRVAWSRFEVDGQDLQGIPVEVLVDAPIRLPRGSQAKTGTELIITSLRQKWRRGDLVELQQELAAFAPPFQVSPDFRIVLDSGAPEVDGVISSAFDATAVLEVDVRLRRTGGVKYRVYSRERSGRRKLHDSGQMKWEQFTVVDGAKVDSSGRRHRLGPVTANIRFYPRKTETLLGTTLNLSDLRSFLDRNAGVRIYRDSVRVRPYGSPTVPEGDWLDLGGRKVSDPAGAGRPTFRVAPTQIVGAVHVGRDTSPELADSAGREGLVHNDAYDDLRRFVLGAVLLLEREYHSLFIRDQEAIAGEVDPPRKVAAEIKEAATVLRRVKRAVESGSAASLDKSLSEVPDVLEILERAGRSADEHASQATILRGLATIGIAGAVFGHETETSLAQVAASSRAALGLLKQAPPDIPESIEEIHTALKHIGKISAWGAFALSRVRRDKRTRRKVGIHTLMSGLLSAFEPVFETSGISLKKDIQAVDGRTFAMDIEAIGINLLTNAYTACRQERRTRQILVRTVSERRENRDGFLIEVADSGPGVATQYRDRIWDPLFTTKVGANNEGSGTGLGLAIVKSIVDEHEGERKVDRHAILRGASFRIWLPLG